MRKSFFVLIFLLVFINLNFPRQNLFRLIKYGSYSQAVRTFNNRANANKRFPNRLNATPLHIAAIFDKYKIAKLLIKKGANINAENKYKATPMHTASFWGSIKVAKLLIENRAKINVKAGSSNNTPLHYASGGGYSGKADYRIAKLLIEKGADVNAKVTGGYKAGWTPLHFAAKAGLSKIGRLLIDNGALINSKGSFRGNTPMHIASAEANIGFINMLISKGADVNAENKRGYTPFDFAKFYNRNRRTVRKIQGLLKRHGGKSGKIKR